MQGKEYFSQSAPASAQSTWPQPQHEATLTWHVFQLSNIMKYFVTA